MSDAASSPSNRPPRNPDDLPDDPAVLKGIIRELLEQLAAAQGNLDDVKQQLDRLLRRLYGRRSEKVDPNHPLLFGTDFANSSTTAAAQAEETSTPKKRRKKTRKHGRRKLPPHLERQQQMHDLDASQKLCPCCGGARVCIGKDSNERLEYRPANFFIVEHVYPKYACPRCADGVTSAPRPPQAIERCLAEPGLLAHVVVSKFADHLPLHRQFGILQRQGVVLRPSTLWGWVSAVAKVLRPLVERMRALILQGRIINSDDTPVTVVSGMSRSRGYLWLYAGDANHRYRVFDFTPTHARDGPTKFLKGFQGYLQVDAYKGYDEVLRVKGIIEVACWAHARRKYVEAETADSLRVAEALARIRALYRVERMANDLGLTGVARAALRQSEAGPVREALGQWLKEQKRQVLPKSPMGEAIRYTLDNWEALGRYLQEGDLTIDNNVSERELRRVAVGRNNWKFVGGKVGGETAAVLYSMIASAQVHGLDPEAYLRDVLARWPVVDAARRDELLPDRWRSSRSELSALASADKPVVVPVGGASVVVAQVPVARVPVSELDGKGQKKK